MIIFINGAFGVGKTTVAKHLVRLLPNAMLFDPEEVGFCLRSILSSIDPVDDFQHYPMWRSLTVHIARLLQESYGRDLVIPMTIWRRAFFNEVVGGLKEFEKDVRHFCLIAPIQTIHERLNRRGEQSPGSWAHLQAVKAVAAFESSLFETRVYADRTTAEELAYLIFSSIHIRSAAA
jgi:chloramphenicol 3-O-phosphotransferase